MIPIYTGANLAPLLLPPWGSRYAEISSSSIARRCRIPFFIGKRLRPGVGAVGGANWKAENGFRLGRFYFHAAMAQRNWETDCLSIHWEFETFSSMESGQYLRELMGIFYSTRATYFGFVLHLQKQNMCIGIYLIVFLGFWRNVLTTEFLKGQFLRICLFTHI